MRIAIDISQVIFGTGVSYYTRNLVKNLLLLDKTNEYILFGGSLRRAKDLKKEAQEMIGSAQNAKIKIFHFPPHLANLAWNKFKILPIETWLGKIDIYHSSDWAQAPSKAKKVTTVHDLAPIFYPKLADKSIVAVHRARLKRIYDEVDKIIAPSMATQNDLLRLGFPADKVKVVYEAVDTEVCKPQPQSKVNVVKKEYQINGKYIMTVGVGERKNTANLIKAFDLSRAGKNLSLIIVGESTHKYDSPRNVRFIGWIPDEKLFTLYSGAEAMVYPSLYEGFGLPVLQAFACECPVVTSNISSTKEIAGDGAILVDPNSVSAIAEGITRALATNKTLVGKGLREIKKYSWTKAAQETLEIYKEALK
jgi:glycosyltransferase involved in cell wall biosynthesis